MVKGMKVYIMMCPIPAWISYPALSVSSKPKLYNNSKGNIAEFRKMNLYNTQNKMQLEKTIGKIYLDELSLKFGI